MYSPIKPKQFGPNLSTNWGLFIWGVIVATCKTPRYRNGSYIYLWKSEFCRAYTFPRWKRGHVGRVFSKPLSQTQASVISSALAARLEADG